MIGYGNYDDVMRVLAGAVTQAEYLVSNRFSAADLYLGSHLAFGMQFGTIEKRPEFEAYAARLTARPAWLRAKDQDDALLPAQQIS
jgi:glutathione S-transferase